MKRSKMILGLCVAGLLISSQASAGEGIFAWVYTTDLLPKGEKEIEHVTTARWQKEHGTYQALDFKEALEYGVTDDFQAAIYLNHHYSKANQSLPEEDPSNPGYRLPGSYVTGGEDVVNRQTEVLFTMSRLDLQASSGLVTGTVPATGYRLGESGLSPESSRPSRDVGQA